LVSVEDRFRFESDEVEKLNLFGVFENDLGGVEEV
jgi:hypothetical protein